MDKERYMPQLIRDRWIVKMAIACLILASPVWATAETTPHINELMNIITLDTADRALERGAFAQAEKLYRKALRNNPRNARACLGLGRTILHQGQSVSDAIYWLSRARRFDSHLPDVDFYMGTAILRDGYPLLAYQTLVKANTSDKHATSSRELAMGTALARMGLQNEAGQYFNRVRSQAGTPELVKQGQQLQTQMENELRQARRFHGLISITTRYDDNPGVVPSSNIFGGALNRSDTFGHQFNAQLDYDLYRASNFTLTSGYALMGTANYDTHRFDILDHAFYLAAANRRLFKDMPVTWGLRADYDNLSVGSDSFLSRTSITPSFTLQHSDRTATTLTFKFTDYNFVDQGANTGTPYDQDSHNYALGILQQTTLLKPELTLSYGYQYNLNLAEGSNFDFQGHRFMIGGKKKLTKRCELNISNWFYLRDYDNRHSTLNLTRHDQQYTLQAGLRYALIEKVTLIFNYLFDRTYSNAASSNYDRQMFEAGIEFNF